jgi:hypothetical protein
MQPLVGIQYDLNQIEAEASGAPNDCRRYLGAETARLAAPSVHRLGGAERADITIWDAALHALRELARVLTRRPQPLAQARAQSQV